MSTKLDTGNMNTALVVILGVLQLITQISLLSYATHFPLSEVVVVMGVLLAFVQTSVARGIVHTQKWAGPFLGRYRVNITPKGVFKVFAYTTILTALFNSMVMGVFYSLCPQSLTQAVPFGGLIALLGTAAAGGVINAIMTVAEMLYEKEV